MPELPDLQAFSHNLQRKLKGKVVKKIAVPKTKKLNVPVSQLKKAVEEQTIREVRREGKALHIEFGNGNVLGLHLMLNGDLHYFEGENPHKHTIIEMQFDDDTGLVLTDFRYMAKPTLNPEISTAPDALSDEVNARFLKAQLTARKGSIKNWLTDQDMIRGIGNAYADEILWDARISPFSICQSIPPAKITALAKSIKKVLKHAEKDILKAHPDIISGEIRDFMMIHNAKKKESPTGAAIQIKTTGGRKTYYTDEQELF